MFAHTHPARNVFALILLSFVACGQDLPPGASSAGNFAAAQPLAGATSPVPPPSSSGAAAVSGSVAAPVGTNTVGVSASGAAGVAGSAGATRAGAPATASSAGASGVSGRGVVPTNSAGSGTAGSAAPEPSGTRPYCGLATKDIVIIGDSYINWASHTLPADLAALAGETWPMYAVGGASMATGGIATLVPDQFEQAVAENAKIRAVVMDGGGNDVLIPAATWAGGDQCKNSSTAGTLPVCQMITKTSFDAATKLMDRMAAVGVSDVVYFYYPHVPKGTLIGGTDPNGILDYALPMIKDICAGVAKRTQDKLHCHFVDMVPVFEGHIDYFAAGDIHPNSTGSAAMAKAIWAVMTEDCVAQKANAACCTSAK
ncbi:MAG: hypothetical protein RL701_6588 [Pseudomonadota bacterium]|jgi:hypothetical protein